MPSGEGLGLEMLGKAGRQAVSLEHFLGGCQAQGSLDHC